jgi:DNA-binding MarR family transcriptional regulator/predicted GNAT family N-acyltransferase
MDAAATETLRRFNRAYTQRIGVLDESYLGTGRALGPSRLLFEVTTDGSRVADLRRRLGLDSGYLSRLLRQLEGDGLIEVAPDRTDRRQRIVTLTTTGRRTRQELDERSQHVAARLVAPLSPRLRSELAAALATADRILRAATVRFDAVDPRSPEAQLAIAAYFSELDRRFDEGFDPGAGGADHDAHMLAAPNGTFLVVTNDENVVGCGGVQCVDERTAEIKRMWIHSDWRGLGLGTRLVERLEIEAAELERQRVVLDTNESLTEAVAMYTRAGYRAIERYNTNPYAHHWFEKSLPTP